MVEPLRELRIPMQLEVRVWGMDSMGKPFSQTARTVDISGQGARLAGITGPKQLGEVLGVQHGNQKARFQVVWVGANGTADQGQIGIACLDAGRCIWAEALKGAPDQFVQGPEILSPGAAVAAAVPAAGVAAQAERRRYPRYACAGAVKLGTEDTDLSTWARLGDIGLGGCYAELMSTLPLQTPVEFAIQVDDLEIRGRGVVRTTHPSVGNGIAFTQMKADDWQRLNHLIARLASPMSREQLQPAVPAAEPDLAQPLQVLLELLEKKGVLTRHEFLTELRRIKSGVRPGGALATAPPKGKSSGDGH
ncbi:MAG TPA: PilZ domain-containing protein [Terriglobales bacterium]|nr:PilZ domain-containing protein [Terriglobales bacterium]